MWPTLKRSIRRRSALRKAAKLLMSKPEKVRQAEKFKAQRTAWQLGDVLGYRLRSGRWIVVRVVGTSEDAGSRKAHVELLAWQGGTPTAESVRSLVRLHAVRFEEHLKDVWKVPESPYQGEQLERWSQAWRSSPRRAEDEARIRRFDGIVQLPTEHEEDFDASRVIALGNQTCEALGGHELGGEFPYPWSRFEELIEYHFDLK